jgi:ribosome-associated translation inhibitor RaiA
MDIEKLDQIVDIISKGDTGAVEGLFSKPGGRKFLESVVLMVMCNLPHVQEDKEDLFIAFRRALDKIEKRIKRQKEGQKILRQVYN